MTKSQSTTALEILDSRGNPTVMVNVTLNNGITGFAPNLKTNTEAVDRNELEIGSESCKQQVQTSIPG
jgi:enolase